MKPFTSSHTDSLRRYMCLLGPKSKQGMINAMSVSVARLAAKVTRTAERLQATETTANESITEVCLVKGRPTEKPIKFAHENVIKSKWQVEIAKEDQSLKPVTEIFTLQICCL